MGVRRGKIFVSCPLRDSICESAMSRDRREGRKKRVACCCSAIVTLVPKMEQGSAAYDVRNTFPPFPAFGFNKEQSFQVKPSRIHHVWNQFPFPSLMMSYVDGPEL